jgi:uncharacterized protein YndB with AHSA1/START domain
MAVPADRLWWGLTDPDALPHWLGTLTSGRFRGGDVVTIQHAEDYFCTSRILECKPTQLLGMTWDFPDEALSHVRIALTPAGRTTHLTLTHDGLGSEAASYLSGWHTHLLYLEDLLMGQPRSMADFWPTYKGLIDS